MPMDVLESIHNESSAQDLMETGNNDYHEQESAIKKRVSKFFEYRDNECSISKDMKDCEHESSEGNFTENKDNTCNKFATEEHSIHTGNEINSDKHEKSRDKELKEEVNNTLHITREEKNSLDVKEMLKNDPDKEGTVTGNDSSKTTTVAVDVNDNLVLKVETAMETESDEKDKVLTPEEEEEITKLVMLAESNYCGEIKPELGDDTGSDESKVDHKKSLENLVTVFKYYPIEDTKIKVERNENSIPMNDRNGPFYIRRSFVPVKYYEDRIASGWWNPTHVLYELCVQCNWPDPEFNLLKFATSDKYWFSVKINNHEFVSYRKARRRRPAKNLASAGVLKFIGFEFSYDKIALRAPGWRTSRLPWCDAYSEFNSIYLAKEEEKSEEFKCSRRSRERKSDIEYARDFKRKRSRSNEYRDTHRAYSPDRREVMKKSRRCDEYYGRRDTSPEYSSRRSHPRIEINDKRKPSSVRDRISFRDDYDRSLSRSSGSKSHRHSDSDRRRQRHYY